MYIPRKCFVFTLPGGPLVRTVLVRPPAHWPRKPSPGQLLSLLDNSEWKGTPQEAEEELRRRIQAMSRALNWPRLALASDDQESDEDESVDQRSKETSLEDGLVWCVAASKRTGNIVLLDREPNLERLAEVKPIVLHFPHRRCMR